MENEVALDVRDDGMGFDPARPDHGFGLVAMRQRIEGLSGTLQVESEPGAGTGDLGLRPDRAESGRARERQPDRRADQAADRGRSSGGHATG